MDMQWTSSGHPLGQHFNAFPASIWTPQWVAESTTSTSPLWRRRPTATRLLCARHCVRAQTCTFSTTLRCAPVGASARARCG